MGTRGGNNRSRGRGSLLVVYRNNPLKSESPLENVLFFQGWGEQKHIYLEDISLLFLHILYSNL